MHPSDLTLTLRDGQTVILRTSKIQYMQKAQSSVPDTFCVIPLEDGGIKHRKQLTNILGRSRISGLRVKVNYKGNVIFKSKAAFQGDEGRKQTERIVRQALTNCNLIEAKKAPAAQKKKRKQQYRRPTPAQRLEMIARS